MKLLPNLFFKYFECISQDRYLTWPSNSPEIICYLHLQGSQATALTPFAVLPSDTFIHLQGSQAHIAASKTHHSLIPLFTYKVLKPLSHFRYKCVCLIPLFTYKVLKHHLATQNAISGLIPLFTYKVLKPQTQKFVRKVYHRTSYVNHWKH